MRGSTTSRSPCGAQCAPLLPAVARSISQAAPPAAHPSPCCTRRVLLGRGPGAGGVSPYHKCHHPVGQHVVPHSTAAGPTTVTTAAPNGNGGSSSVTPELPAGTPTGAAADQPPLTHATAPSSTQLLLGVPDVALAASTAAATSSAAVAAAASAVAVAAAASAAAAADAALYTTEAPSSDATPSPSSSAVEKPAALDPSPAPAVGAARSAAAGAVAPAAPEQAPPATASPSTTVSQAPTPSGAASPAAPATGVSVRTSAEDGEFCSSAPAVQSPVAPQPVAPNSGASAGTSATATALPVPGAAVPSAPPVASSAAAATETAGAKLSSSSAAGAAPAAAAGAAPAATAGAAPAAAATAAAPAAAALAAAAAASLPPAASPAPAPAAVPAAPKAPQAQSQGTAAAGGAPQAASAPPAVNPQPSAAPSQQTAAAAASSLPSPPPKAPSSAVPATPSAAVPGPAKGGSSKSSASSQAAAASAPPAAPHSPPGTSSQQQQQQQPSSSSSQAQQTDPSITSASSGFQLAPIHVVLFALIFVGGALFATLTLQFTRDMEFTVAVQTVIRRVAKSVAFRQLCVIGGAILLVRFGLNGVLRTLASFTSNPVQWDKSKLYYVLREVYQPLELLLFIAAFCTLADSFLPQLIAIPKSTVTHVVKSTLSVSFILGAATVIFNLKTRFCKENAWQAEMKGDVTSQRRWEAYDKLGTFVVYTITFVLGIQAIGLEVTSVLAIGGIGGLAIGLAGREICENLLNGFLIMSTNPFEVGDEIQFFPPGRNVEGFVTDIGWYRTTIRSFEREVYVIPNSIFSKNIVLNISRKNREWRFFELLAIRAQDVRKAGSIIQDMRRIVRNDTRIINKLHRRIFLDKLTKEEVKIYISFYVEASNREAFMTVKQDLLLAFVDCVERNGARLASPRISVELEPETAAAINPLLALRASQEQKLSQEQPLSITDSSTITAEAVTVSTTFVSTSPGGGGSSSSSSGGGGSGGSGGGGSSSKSGGGSGSKAASTGEAMMAVQSGRMEYAANNIVGAAGVVAQPVQRGENAAAAAAAAGGSPAPRSPGAMSAGTVEVGPNESNSAIVLASFDNLY